MVEKYHLSILYFVYQIYHGQLNDLDANGTITGTLHPETSAEDVLTSQYPNKGNVGAALSDIDTRITSAQSTANSASTAASNAASAAANAQTSANKALNQLNGISFEIVDGHLNVVYDDGKGE
jgi:hypothetical protein